MAQCRRREKPHGLLPPLAGFRGKSIAKSRRGLLFVYRFKTDAEAVKMANDTEFGLASYFYSRDRSRRHHGDRRLVSARDHRRATFDREPDTPCDYDRKANQSPSLSGPQPPGSPLKAVITFCLLKSVMTVTALGPLSGQQHL